MERLLDMLEGVFRGIVFDIREKYSQEIAKEIEEFIEPYKPQILDGTLYIYNEMDGQAYFKEKDNKFIYYENIDEIDKGTANKMVGTYWYLVNTVIRDNF